MQFVWAFLIGGLICVIGQILIDKTNLTPARILTAFVVAGVVLGALGLYQPLIDFAGEGAAVPISGFGNLMAGGMRDALKDDGALGILTGDRCAEKLRGRYRRGDIFQPDCGVCGKI